MRPTQIRFPIITLIFFAATGDSFLWAQDAVYQDDFNGQLVWKAQGPAEGSPYGRSGRSLKISTYVTGGEKAQWMSPDIPVHPGAYTISAWMAQNLAFTQDPGYGGMLAAVTLDADNKELSREAITVVYKPPYRDLYDFHVIPECGGLEWNYYEQPITAPAGAAKLRLVFGWSDFLTAWRIISTTTVKGDVYLDDVVVTPGAGATALASAIEIKRSYSYRLRINTAAPDNVFVKTEPLEFTVRLDGPKGPPVIKPGMKLVYRVEDFQRLLIADGSIPLQEPFSWWSAAPSDANKSLLKTFCLGDAVREQVGRWMALVVSLEDQGQVLARGEMSFVITDPRKLTPEQAEISHFYHTGHRKTPKPPAAPGTPAPLDEYERQGLFSIASLGWDANWKDRQPRREDPIRFETEKTYRYEERDSLGYLLMHYTQVPEGVPGWARLPGKKYREEDFVDPEAYGAYVREYVRHTRAKYYEVISPEGGDVSLYPEMVKAAYRAVKSVDPRIQVVVQCEFNRGKDHAKLLCDTGLIDFFDVLLFDIYTNRVGPSVRDFRTYAEEHGKHKQYWIQEYSYTGSTDQEETARQMVNMITWAIAVGVDKLSWYGDAFEIDGVRAPLPTGGCVYAMRGMVKDQGEKLFRGMTGVPSLSHTPGYVKGNLTPLLQWATYYQLIQHLAIEQFREFVEWGPNVEGALFDGNGYSTAVVWRPTNIPSQTMRINTGGVPYRVTDLYGRTRRITPRNGTSLLTIGPNPLFLRFDQKVATFTAKPADVTIGLTPGAFMAGADTTIAITVKNSEKSPLAAKVKVAIDRSWRCELGRETVQLPPGQTSTLQGMISAPKDLAGTEVPVMISLQSPEGLFGWLQETVPISPPVTVKLRASPYTPKTAARVEVTVKNSLATPVSGQLEIQGDLGNGPRPNRPRAEITVLPGTEKTLEFPLDGWRPSMDRDYHTTATLMAGNQRIRCSEDLSFRPVVKRSKPITVDGEPGDWPLDQLVTFDFFRVRCRSSGMDPRTFNIQDMKWKGLNDASGKFYVQWDDARLYFLFRMKDASYQPGGKGVEIWSHDALHFLLYPWGVRLDETIRGIPYKEHIGLDQDGIPTYDRCQGTVGDWSPGSSGRPPGVEIAIRPAKDGTIVMEFSVPFEQFVPLQPKAGSRFALAVSYFDDASEGVGFYYATANIDINPAHFGNFTLIE
ncbi:MAG: hypothetical protein HY360_04770 [Verrucomicrobia bacterium]|nr:hypothetical protein [Verrucomicrobiota bacterium]